MKSYLRPIAAALALSAAGATSAATVNFNLANGPGIDDRQSSFNFSSSGLNLTISASNLVAYRYDGIGVSSTNIEAGEFNSYAGHNGVESLTFTFDQSIQLNSISFYLFDNNIDQVLMTYGSNSLTINKNSDAVFSTPLTLNSFTLTAQGLGTSTRISGLSVDTSAVPVPAAAWLMGSGLLGLAGMARRRRAS